jgi:hypothetical protein
LEPFGQFLLGQAGGLTGFYDWFAEGRLPCRMN